MFLVCYFQLALSHNLVENILLAPVVRELDNAIQWINVIKTNHAIHWIVIYPVDSVIHLLNKPGLIGSLTQIWNQEHEETKGRVGPDEFMQDLSESPKLPLVSITREVQLTDDCVDFMIE